MAINPPNIPLVICQGSTFNPAFFFRARQTGQLIDWTGHTARMKARPSKASDTVLLDMTTGNGKIIIDGTYIRLLLTASDTAALTFATAVYDLELVSGDGIVYRVIEGILTLNKEVTR